MRELGICLLQLVIKAMVPCYQPITLLQLELWRFLLSFFYLYLYKLLSVLYQLFQIEMNHKDWTFHCVWWINSLWTMNMNIYLRSSRQQGKERVFDLWKRLMIYCVLFKFLVMTCVMKYLQIMISFVLRKYLGISGANFAKNLLRAAILLQYFPRLFRFLPLLIGQSPTGFIFESAWANFIINLLFFMLSGHVGCSG